MATQPGPCEEFEEPQCGVAFLMDPAICITTSLCPLAMLLVFFGVIYFVNTLKLKHCDIKKNIVNY